MSFWEKVKLLFQSRKFWALIAAVTTAVGAHMTGNISVWEMVQAIVAALAVYSTAIAIVDAAAEGKKNLQG